MRCWFKSEPHGYEDCPAARAAAAIVHLNGSGPAGWEVERADRSGALPLAQADDELDLIEDRLEGRGPVQFTPPAGPAPSPSPISLAERRRPTPLHAGRRTRAAEELFETLGSACARAAGTGVQTIEVDWMDVSALLLHAAALEEGLAYAAANHGCEGGDCAWADEMNRVMDGVLS